MMNKTLHMDDGLKQPPNKKKRQIWKLHYTKIAKSGLSNLMHFLKLDKYDPAREAPKKEMHGRQEN